jgi:hypothetical protein
LQLSGKGRIIAGVNPSLASSLMRSSKRFLDSLRAGSFLVTEVALEVYEHPKPDSFRKAFNYSPKSNPIRRFF